MKTEETITEGVRLAREGKYREALKVFDQNLGFTQEPQAMSYFALCLAEVEGDCEKAISLCLVAAEKEFYNPDIYLNLGRILLIHGQKKLAIKAFRKGLRFDEAHPGLSGELKKLGTRRKPVISFLRRDNPLNRYLGLLADHFAGDPPLSRKVVLDLLQRKVF